MGYYTNSVDVDALLLREHIPDATNVLLKEYGTYETYESWKGDMQLVEVLRNRGYPVKSIREGLEFLYITEGKHYDMDRVMKLLAPYMRNDSEITMKGEEGEQFRYTFQDGDVYYTEAQIVWPNFNDSNKL